MTTPEPVVSVVICTHDRARDLDEALASLERQDVARDRFEVLVVDNRSTDDTKAVTERRAATLPLRYVFEGRLGLSTARNAGWRAARGTYVAFLDDDAIAARDWVRSVEAAFVEGGERLGCVGGRVDPIWEIPRPAWLSDQVSLGLTILNLSDRPKPITDVRAEWLVGANIAFRRDLLARAEGFHEELGRIGNRLLSSEETMLLKQILAFGYSVLYHPAMRVDHKIPASRLRREWFRRRYYWQGVSDALEGMIGQPLGWGARIAEAARRSRDLIRARGAVRRLAARPDDPAEFERQCWDWIAVGHIAGLLGAARR